LHEPYLQPTTQPRRLVRLVTQGLYYGSPALYRAVIENFCRLHEDGIIYRANRLVNWCVRLTTTLSNLEVDQKASNGREFLSVPGYREKVITSFAYPIEDSATQSRRKCERQHLIAENPSEIAESQPHVLCLYDVCDVFKGGIAPVLPSPSTPHLHGKFAIHPFIPGRKMPIITDAEAVDMEF
ncbi:hypothetical protein K525DRAFT_246247, partial [Schizophyllum commune Loenen D]